MQILRNMFFIFIIIHFVTIYSEIIIRQATLDDFTNICQHIDEEYKKHFRDVFAQIPVIINLEQDLDNFMDEKITQQKNNTLEFLTKQINHKEYHILVAYNNKQLLGYCRFRKINDQTVYIYSLSVATNAQRQGIGTKLLFTAINTFDTITQCALRAFITNDQAHNFYSKLGFEKIGTCSLDPKTGVLSQDINATPTHVDYRLIIKK